MAPARPSPAASRWRRWPGRPRRDGPLGPQLLQERFGRALGQKFLLFTRRVIQQGAVLGHDALEEADVRKMPSNSSSSRPVTAGAGGPVARSRSRAATVGSSLRGRRGPGCRRSHTPGPGNACTCSFLIQAPGVGLLADGRNEKQKTHQFIRDNITRYAAWAGGAVGDLEVHRLSTLRDAVRIYGFDDGKIVEKGDYAELLRQGGLFTQLAACARGARRRTAWPASPRRPVTDRYCVPSWSVNSPWKVILPTRRGPHAEERIAAVRSTAAPLDSSDSRCRAPDAHMRLSLDRRPACDQPRRSISSHADLFELARFTFPRRIDAP